MIVSKKKHPVDIILWNVRLDGSARQSEWFVITRSRVQITLEASYFFVQSLRSGKYIEWQSREEHRLIRPVSIITQSNFHGWTGLYNPGLTLHHEPGQHQRKYQDRIKRRDRSETRPGERENNPGCCQEDPDQFLISSAWNKSAIGRWQGRKSKGNLYHKRKISRLC